MADSDDQTPGSDDLELVHLRAFIAFIETANPSEAASRLGIHFRSLGRYLDKVELYFGKGLFEGDRDRGKLTGRGEIAERAAREAIAVLEAARERIKVECPVLRVGFVRMMRPLVERARRKNVTAHTPKTVDLRLFELTSEQQARRLAARELDMAICFNLPALSNAPDLYEFEVSEHPYVLAVPEHVVATNGELSIELLNGLHYAHPPSRLSADVLASGDTWLKSKGITPKTRIECELATQIIAYAGSGDGFGFVPALWCAASREGVTFIPLPRFDAIAKISLYTLDHARENARRLRVDLQHAARAALEGL